MLLAIAALTQQWPHTADPSRAAALAKAMPLNPALAKAMPLNLADPPSTRATALVEAMPWLNSADPPATRAAALVKAMNISEKVHMFHGSCDGYVGNVCGNERLGIPALKMNDGPQGYRDNAHPGSSTAWPCSLAIGATFDRAAAYAWGAAMGDEFYRKGSNVQLGPGMCIARVPRNGRNFEYISGEDPYLGYVMVQPVINGIQSQGVVANAKVRVPSTR